MDVIAPDFSLPDLDGNTHRLSDLRGRKVFLFVHGSYCSCSYDLPAWQVIYEELRDQGVEFVAVALDAGGAMACSTRLRGEVTETDDVLRPLLGWSEEHWARRSPPTYPCLIDTEHVVAGLFGMNNIGQAVWIDEEGRIVRPAESAGLSDGWRSLDTETFAIPADDAAKAERNRGRYVDALRDWVANGADSYAALSPDEVRARMRAPTEEDERAAEEARLGARCLRDGDHAGAERHFRAAAELAPDRWNYRRQALTVSPEMIGQLSAVPEFFDAVDALGDGAYYEPIDLPGMERFSR